jgi:uncharacterized protein (TIGR03000 family)
MFRRIRGLCALALLAILAALTMTHSAAADQGMQTFGGFGRGHSYEASGGSYGYRGAFYGGTPAHSWRPGYYVAPYSAPYVQLVPYSAPAWQAGPYYFTSLNGMAANGDRPVSVIVSAPADAEIWFDRHKTTQTGTVRRFESPPLAAGEYTYEVRVLWKQAGKALTRTRRVTVHPGDVINLSFTADRP